MKEAESLYLIQRDLAFFDGNFLTL